MSSAKAEGESRALVAAKSSAMPVSTSLAITAYVVVAIVGLIIRVATFPQFTGHIDEPASLLAIQRVAETGFPMFPSGVLYLQGAVISYLAAPLAWVFSGESLFAARQVLNLILSMLLIPLSMKLISTITGSIWPAILAGVLIACDPNLIVWSVTLRPYGLLAVEVVAALLLFTMLLKEGPQARIPGLGRVIYLIPILVTLGTFTHIGFWLMIPALTISALMVWKSRLLTTHRSILISGLVSFIPLMVFLLLGRYVGTGAGTGEGGVSDSFVGSHLVDPQRVLESLDPNWWIWVGNFNLGTMHELMPYLIAVMSGALAIKVISRTNPPDDLWRSQAMGIVVVVHWSVIVAVTFLVTTDPDTRHLHQVLALGYMILALAIWCFWQQVGALSIWDNIVFRSGIVLLLVLPSLLHGVTRAQLRTETPGGAPDYWQATSWAAEHRDDNQIVILALPTSAYFFFDEEEFDHLMFLAGPENGQRARRYIQPNSFGVNGDYWLGLNSIGATAQLCTTLLGHAGNALIVVDNGRLSAPWR